VRVEIFAPSLVDFRPQQYCSQPLTSQLQPSVHRPHNQKRKFLNLTPHLMTIFAYKDAFLDLGLEGVHLSAAHVSQDCSICCKPLAVHDNHASPQSKLRGYHSAIRIRSCGHMHGEVCLKAWLDIGNSCPTCNRILFELGGDPITQQDVNKLVFTLGPLYGERRVMAAVVGMVQKQEREQAMLRRYHEQEVAKQNIEDAKARDDEFTLGEEDFLDSEEEMNSEEEDGDGNDEDGDDEDGDEEYEPDGEETNEADK
jgi:hypothetical protein